jgi:type II secretory pathway component PulK
MNGRHGFALLAVLWVVVALAAVAAGAVELARADAAVTGDRSRRMRGRWAAEACLAVAQSRMETTLRGSSAFAAPPSDTLSFANGARCTTVALDPASRLNLDSTSAAMRARFDSARAAGIFSASALDTLVTRYGDGRINVNSASPVVLAALPGFDNEVLRVITESRAWRRPLADLPDLLSRVAPAQRARLLDHYPELAGVTAFRSAALVLTAHGWVDGARPEAVIEVLAVNGGIRVAIVRRRMY